MRRAIGRTWPITSFRAWPAHDLDFSPLTLQWSSFVPATMSAVPQATAENPFFFPISDKVKEEVVKEDVRLCQPTSRIVEL